jgi:23S rRNA (guanosine2251-2'-O)-methyltransferase
MEQRTERKYRKERIDIIFGIRAVIEAVNADKELNKILIQKGLHKELFDELKRPFKGKTTSYNSSLFKN